MKSDKNHITKLADQPEYRAEAETLACFVARLGETKSKLADAQAAAQLQNAAATGESAIERANLLLSGTPAVRQDDLIFELTEAVGVLTNAVTEQRAVVAKVVQRLSHEVCGKMAEQHKAAVRNLVDAVAALEAANAVEASIRDEIESAGYRQALPFMTYAPPDYPVRLHDVSGGYSAGWFRDAANYTQTANQKATEARRNRLESLV